MSALACLLTLLLAAASYLTSPQQRLLAVPLRRRRIVLLPLAAAAAVAWVAALGTAAGLMAMLAALMLGTVALPYVVAWRGAAR
ncbi:hypothetical protein [Jeongeupia sp. USM3]|uniref:hypothetical protein n=1 Tax=Jeongeupia sp. USM3 TaxID=1906741 RepID=UPI00089DE464|nr:hypothetical protein [Jeongeupia sp. USM3]AOY00725.1 hypothetical protein BJP62_09930 [Jeongeupia sp. USM3]